MELLQISKNQQEAALLPFLSLHGLHALLPESILFNRLQYLLFFFSISLFCCPIPGGGGCHWCRCGSKQQRFLCQPMGPGQCIFFLRDDHHNHRWVSSKFVKITESQMTSQLHLISIIYIVRFQIHCLSTVSRFWKHFPQDKWWAIVLHFLCLGGDPHVRHPAGWSWRPSGHWTEESHCQNRDSLPG